MIKKVLCSMISACTLSAVAGNDIPDLSTFSRSQASICFDENFNSDISRWIRPGKKHPQSFAVEKHIGVTGSPAITVTSSDASNMSSWKVPVKVVPGMAYRISFHYRLNNLKLKTPGRRRATVIVCTLHAKDKNGAKIRDFNIWVPAEDTGNELRFFSETVVMPQNANPDTFFSIHVDWWHNGTFIFDDFTISSLEVPAELQLTYPDRMTMDKDGKISIRYQRNGENVPENAEVLLEVGGMKKLAAFANGLFTANFGKVPGEKIKVKATLFNRKEQKILAEHEWELNNTIDTPPVSYIDEYHRLIVDGKPFMPIGTYIMMPMNDAHFRRLQEAGFNTIQVQPMSGTGVGRPKRGHNTSENLLSYINLAAGYNLKTLMFLQLMIPEKEFIRKDLEKSFNGKTALEDIIREIGTTLRGNSNVIGYYLADENTSHELPSTELLRRRINFADPTHVTTTLSNTTSFIDSYINTGDVFLFDSYPFNHQRTPGVQGDLVYSDRSFARIASTGTPFWLVPQGFDWARHPARQMFGKTPEEKRRHRIPSAEELTALPLLGAIYGAKGFVFYSYHEVFVHGDNVQPGFSDIFWPRVVQAVQALKQLEPFIMSTESVSQVAVTSTAGTLRSRTFSANGKIAVVIVGIKNETNNGEGVLPAGKKFTSLYGRTQIDGSKFTFTSSGVNYDVLISE